MYEEITVCPDVTMCAVYCFLMSQQRIAPTECSMLWRLIKEISTKIGGGKACRGAFMPYLSISITPNRKLSSTPNRRKSVRDPNRKRYTLHSQTGSAATLLQQEEDFPFAEQQAQPMETPPLSQWETIFTWTLTFLQWIFLLLMTSFSYSPFHKSISSCITFWSISLLNEMPLN